MPPCNAPPKSSRQLELLSAEFFGAPIAQCAVNSRCVVVVDPRLERHLDNEEVGEVVLPDALLLHRAEEAFDAPVLLGRVGCDVLLFESIVGAGCAAATAVKDQAVIAA